MSIFERIKFFPLEISCLNMIPGTKYDVYLEGILYNDRVKPYGKNLGDSVVSDNMGRVIFQLMLHIPYNEKYITNNMESGVINKNKVIELIDPAGRISKTYIPMVLKN